ncbi:unnamed protein product [Orchesella dallaii]|uniref:Uncharacterized protein n=1 Tax=Orchesella dallaii TaxID=48710 RepID=A0ABP1PQ10_9HEXA
MFRQFSNGATMPYLSMEEYHRYRLLLKMEITKAYPSDGDDTSDMVVQEADDKLNVTSYKFGAEAKPVFLSVGLKNMGKDVVVLLRGDDYIDPLNKKKFVVLRKRGSGNEYNVHLAQLWRDLEDKLHVIFEDAKISVLPSVSKLIAYLHDGLFTNPPGQGSMRPRCSWFGFTLLCDNGGKLKLADIADLFAGSYGVDEGESLEGDEEGYGTSGNQGSNNGDDDGTMGSSGGAGTSNIEDGSRKGSTAAGGGQGTGGTGGGKGTSTGGAGGTTGGIGTSTGGAGATGGGKGTSTGGAGGTTGGKGTSTGGAAGSGGSKGTSTGAAAGSGGSKGTSTGGTGGSGGADAGKDDDDGIPFDVVDDEEHDGEYYVKIKGEGAPGSLARKTSK